PRRPRRPYGALHAAFPDRRPAHAVALYERAVSEAGGSDRGLRNPGNARSRSRPCASGTDPNQRRRGSQGQGARDSFAAQKHGIYQRVSRCALHAVEAGPRRAGNETAGERVYEQGRERASKTRTDDTLRAKPRMPVEVDARTFWGRGGPAGGPTVEIQGVRTLRQLLPPGGRPVARVRRPGQT